MDEEEVILCDEEQDENKGVDSNPERTPNQNPNSSKKNIFDEQSEIFGNSKDIIEKEAEDKDDSTRSANTDEKEYEANENVGTTLTNISETQIENILQTNEESYTRILEYESENEEEHTGNADEMILCDDGLSENEDTEAMGNIFETQDENSLLSDGFETETEEVITDVFGTMGDNVELSMEDELENFEESNSSIIENDDGEICTKGEKETSITDEKESETLQYQSEDVRRRSSATDPSELRDTNSDNEAEALANTSVIQSGLQEDSVEMKMDVADEKNSDVDEFESDLEDNCKDAEDSEMENIESVVENEHQSKLPNKEQAKSGENSRNAINDRQEENLRDSEEVSDDHKEDVEENTDICETQSDKEKNSKQRQNKQTKLYDSMATHLPVECLEDVESAKRVSNILETDNKNTEENSVREGLLNAINEFCDKIDETQNDYEENPKKGFENLQANVGYREIASIIEIQSDTDDEDISTAISKTQNNKANDNTLDVPEIWKKDILKLRSGNMKDSKKMAFCDQMQIDFEEVLKGCGIIGGDPIRISVKNASNEISGLKHSNVLELARDIQTKISHVQKPESEGSTKMKRNPFEDLMDCEDPIAIDKENLNGTNEIQGDILGLYCAEAAMPEILEIEANRDMEKSSKKPQNVAKLMCNEVFDVSKAANKKVERPLEKQNESSNVSTRIIDFIEIKSDDESEALETLEPSETQNKKPLTSEKHAEGSFNIVDSIEIQSENEDDSIVLPNILQKKDQRGESPEQNDGQGSPTGNVSVKIQRDKIEKCMETTEHIAESQDNIEESTAVEARKVEDPFAKTLDLNNLAQSKGIEEFKFKRRLINAVRKHSLLYDTKSKGFHNAEAKTQAWEAIAKKLKKDVLICKETWLDLRYNYQIYVRKLRKFLWSNSKRKNSPDLSFLDRTNVSLKKRPIIAFERDLLFLWRFIPDWSRCRSVTAKEYTIPPADVQEIPVIDIEQHIPSGALNLEIDESADIFAKFNIKYDRNILFVTPKLCEFLNLFKEYPEMYDLSHRHYNDYRRKAIVWSALAFELNEKATELMKLWIYLQTRFEWEMCKTEMINTDLKAFMKFLSLHTTLDKTTLYKESFYLKRNWHEPLKNVKEIEHLISIIGPINSPVIAFSRSTNMGGTISTEYTKFWKKVGRGSPNFTPGQCEITWLIMRKLCFELTEMRKHGYHFKDNWQFEKIVFDLLEKVKNKNSVKPKTIKADFHSNSYAFSVPILPLADLVKELNDKKAEIKNNTTNALNEKMPLSKDFESEFLQSIAPYLSKSNVKISKVQANPNIVEPDAIVYRLPSSTTLSNAQGVPFQVSPYNNSSNSAFASLPQQSSLQQRPPPLISFAQTASNPNISISTIPKATNLKAIPNLTPKPTFAKKQKKSVPKVANSSSPVLTPSMVSNNSTYAPAPASNAYPISLTSAQQSLESLAPYLSNSNLRISEIPSTAVSTSTVLTTSQSTLPTIAKIVQNSNLKISVVSSGAQLLPGTIAGSVLKPAAANRKRKLPTAPTVPPESFLPPNLPEVPSIFYNLTPTNITPSQTGSAPIGQFAPHSNLRITAVSSALPKVPVSVLPSRSVTKRMKKLPNVANKSSAQQSSIPTQSSGDKFIPATFVSSAAYSQSVPTNTSSTQQTPPAITQIGSNSGLRISSVSSAAQSEVALSVQTSLPSISTVTNPAPSISTNASFAVEPSNVPSFTISDPISLSHKKHNVLTMKASNKNTHKMSIKLEIGAKDSLLIIESPTKTYMLQRKRVALFIRYILAIPQLHNKQLTLDDTNKYWEYISVFFEMPSKYLINYQALSSIATTSFWHACPLELKYICVGCWDFLEENFQDFDQIAPMKELMKPFPVFPDMQVWQEGSGLFDNLNELATSRGWSAYVDKLPSLMSEMSKYPEMYIKHIVSPVLLYQFPDIRDLVEICLAFKDVFVNYMTELEKGISHQWPQQWWRVLVQLAFLVRVRYNELEPYFYIVKNKMHEEIDRCTRLDIKNAHYQAIKLSRIKANFLSGLKIDPHKLIHHVRQHPNIYMKCKNSEKIKAWKEVARLISESSDCKQVCSVADCKQVFCRAFQYFFLYKNLDVANACSVNYKYFKDLLYIYNTVKQKNQIVTKDDEIVMNMECFDADIKMDCAQTRLVMKNWCHAIQDFPTPTQNSMRKAMVTLFRKHRKSFDKLNASIQID